MDGQTDRQSSNSDSSEHLAERRHATDTSILFKKIGRLVVIVVLKMNNFSTNNNNLFQVIVWNRAMVPARVPPAGQVSALE